jgi:hypothetical protein
VRLQPQYQSSWKSSFVPRNVIGLIADKEEPS